MKKILITALAASALLAGALGLAACKKDKGSQPPPTEFDYTLSEDGTHYSVSGLGNVKDTDIQIPETYNGKPVTEIGEYAFRYKSSLTSISLPDSVTTIGKGAFTGCSSITAMPLPDGLKTIGDSAFEGCYAIKSISLPDGLTSLGESAFEHCYSLMSINIPAGLTEIESNTFLWCTSLTSITIPSNITTIHDYAFNCCYNLIEVYNLSTSVKIITGENWSDEYKHCTGFYALDVYNSETAQSKLTTDDEGYVYYSNSGVIFLIGYGGDETRITLPDFNGKNYEIYKYAFYRNPSLTSVTVPAKVSRIGSHAFSNCLALKSVYISDGVNRIDDNVFSDSYQLEEITIGENMEIISDFAFSSCMSLKNIIIPSEVLAIGKGIFSDCNRLESITVANDNTVYYSENNCIIKTDDKELVAGCKTSTIPEGILKIGDYAFAHINIKVVVIPETVTVIGERAFASTDIAEIVIPASVTKISEGAFFSCSSLKSAEFKSSNDWVLNFVGNENITADMLTDKATAAEYLRSTYRYYCWELVTDDAE